MAKPFTMAAIFYLCQRKEDILYPVTKDRISYLSTGKYSFIVNGKEIPVDWDNALLSYGPNSVMITVQTGYGDFFNDFSLSKGILAEHKELGIRTEELSAKWLASCSRIDEFFVLADIDGVEEAKIGHRGSEYTLRLLAVEFYDHSEGRSYFVAPEVLTEFNNR